MEQPNKYLNEIFSKAKQKPLTIKNRISFLKSIAIMVDPTPVDLSFLRREKIVLARVFDTDNLLTPYNRLCHIVKAIELAKDSVSKKTLNRYTQLLRKLKPEKTAIETDNRLTDEQKRRYLTLSQVKTFLEHASDELFKEYGFERRLVTDSEIERLKAVKNRKQLNLFNFAKKFQQLAIMACYVYQPALRNNFVLMKITKQKRNAINDKEFNYYYIDNRNSKSYIIMNNYKNVAHMGTGVQLGSISGKREASSDS